MPGRREAGADRTRAAERGAAAWGMQPWTDAATTRRAVECEHGAAQPWRARSATGRPRPRAEPTGRGAAIGIGVATRQRAERGMDASVVGNTANDETPPSVGQEPIPTGFDVFVLVLSVFSLVNIVLAVAPVRLGRRQRRPDRRRRPLPHLPRRFPAAAASRTVQARLLRRRSGLARSARQPAGARVAARPHRSASSASAAPSATTGCATSAGRRWPTGPAVPCSPPSS